MKKLLRAVLRIVFFLYIMFVGFVVTVVYNHPKRWLSGFATWVTDWPESWRASQLDG